MRVLFSLSYCAAMLALTACDTRPRAGDRSPSKLPELTNLAEAAPPELPTVEQPLTRRDLILAAIEAANDVMVGTDDAERQQGLDGRRFSFRIRLCVGTPSSGRLTFDPEGRVLRASVSADITAENPVAAALSANRFEAVEGFWVPYPWLLQASCPPAPPSPAPDTIREAAATTSDPARPTFGLAEFFSPDTDRSIRREGRPFSVTRRLEEGSAPGPIDLVLRGRLIQLPDAKVINCQPNATMLPPQCIVSVRFDVVRLEQANGGELLAAWSGA